MVFLAYYLPAKLKIALIVKNGVMNPKFAMLVKMNQILDILKFQHLTENLVFHVAQEM